MAKVRDARRRRGAPGAWFVMIMIGVGTMGSAKAHAKEGHFEKVKFELIQLYIQCTTCHVTEKGDEGLTPYGERIAKLGEAASVRERVRRMERRVSDYSAQRYPGGENDRIDIDGDGVLNWVEILCQTDPSDPKSKPDLPEKEDDPPTTRQRVETVVDCMLCHTSVETGGDKENAPHNAFGEALAKLNPAQAAPGRAGRPTSPQPSDILDRLKKMTFRDTDRDKARDWDEVVSFRHPADANDTPIAQEIQSAKDRVAALRRRQDGFGKAHPEP